MIKNNPYTFSWIAWSICTDSDNTKVFDTARARNKFIVDKLHLFDVCLVAKEAGLSRVLVLTHNTQEEKGKIKTKGNENGKDNNKGEGDN